MNGWQIFALLCSWTLGLYIFWLDVVPWDQPMLKAGPDPVTGSSQEFCTPKQLWFGCSLLSLVFQISGLGVNSQKVEVNPYDLNSVLSFVTRAFVGGAFLAATVSGFFDPILAPLRQFAHVIRAFR